MSFNKTIAVIGLGLIGGSIAKAAAAHGHRCYGFDIDRESINQAVAEGVIAGEWNSNIACDVYIVALYESDTITFIKDNLHSFKKGAIVCDICGNKRGICSALTALCAKHELFFVGTHPMQGRTSSGYKHSSATLFDGASMIVCRDDSTDEDAIANVKQLSYELKFKKVVTCTPSEHDAMLSYTSQLAHILSSVYVQNEKSQKHIGFSAGSFRDLSRVSELSADMWSELMINNKDNLLADIECYEKILGDFKQSLQVTDKHRLHGLLSNGNSMKLRSKKGHQ